MRIRIIFLLMILLMTVPILAQETPPIDTSVDTSAITDDMVNEVAEKLYCPVCENIPLDTCGTLACKDWREEIRMMLASDMKEDAIVDNFVARFGDRVVGIPKNPVLRAMSLITPWVMLLIGLLVAGWTIFNWKQRSEAKDIPEHESDDDNPYKDMLEKDLAG